MVMMKLKLVKVNTTNEADYAANGTAPDRYMNHRIKILKELVETWEGKGDKVVASD